MSTQTQIPISENQRICDELIAKIKYLRSIAPTWRDVDVELPENDSMVNIFRSSPITDRKQDVGFFEKLTGEWFNNLGVKIHDVTHWMLQPASPERKEAV